MNFLGNNSIMANHASRDGGGFYIRDDSAIILLGTNNFKINSADYTGGGISAFESSLDLAGKNTFDGNHAEEFIH